MCLKYDIIPKYVTFSRNSEDETNTPGSNNQLEPEPTFLEEKIISFLFTVQTFPPRYYPFGFIEG